MSIFEPETLKSSLEIVTCSLCLAPNSCGPILPSDWRAMRIDGQSHFICAAHFPDCDCNDPSAWRAAYAQVVRRSGLVASVQAYCVYDGDFFDAGLGDSPYIHHKPLWDGKRDDESIRYVYAVARLKDGTLLMEIMTKGEVDKIRGRSRAGNTGPWVTDYAEMAKKTILRRLCKILPMSINAADAMEIDSDNEFGGVDAATGEILAPARPAQKESDITGGLQIMPQAAPSAAQNPPSDEHDQNPFVETPEAQTDEELREAAWSRLTDTPGFNANPFDDASLRTMLSGLLNRKVARISALTVADFEEARQNLLARNAEQGSLLDAPAGDTSVEALSQ